MQGPLGDGTDDDPHAEPAPSTERTWVHPSELGWEHRKRSDRRRGMWLGAGLVVGGFGLLAVCVAMGVGSGSPGATASASPRDAVATTLASLTVVDADGRHTVTGVVVDDDGHVVVRASALGDSTEVWASCAGREPALAEVIAESAEDDLAVVAMGEGSGRAVTSDPDVVVGDEVLIANAGAGEAAPVLRRAVVTHVPTPRSASGSAPDGRAATPSITIAALGPTVTTQLAAATSAATTARSSRLPVDGAAFDDRGRFVGLVISGSSEQPQVLPAAAVLELALELAR